jgi:apolipoprotein N-acyltransferase
VSAGCLIAALLAGAMYGLPFVDPGLGFLSFIGLAPLLAVVGRRASAPRSGATLVLSAIAIGTGTVMTAMPLARISPIAVAVQSSFKVWWPLTGTLLFVWLRRRTGWPIVILWPCAWVFTEWAWSYYSLGVAFGLSGYTMFRYLPLIQVADIGGVLAVSFVVQTAVGAIADVATDLAERHPTSPSRSLGRVLAPLVGAAALVAVSLSYGTIRILQRRSMPGPRLAMIQPAIPHGFSPAEVQLVHRKQLGLAERYIRKGEVDLVVFPENAVISYIEGTPYLEDLRSLSSRLGTPLLAGVTTRTRENLARWKRGEPEEGIRVGEFWSGFNHTSAALITADGIVDRYDKLHLLPFTERMPAEGLARAFGLLDPYRRFIVSVLGYIGTAIPGEGMRLLRVPGAGDAKFWAPLCFEQANGRLARRARLDGARFFINVTSEGDLGPQIYWNTVAVSTIRAVEMRVGIARCGNTGITCMIDPWGRLERVLRGPRARLWGEPGVLKGRAPLGPPDPTVYARLGDWPAAATALLLAAAAWVAIRRRRRTGP